MSVTVASTSKISLGVLRSKVSYHCIFIIKEFDYRTKRRYGTENSKNMKFVVDTEFIDDFLEILNEKKSVEFDGVPRITSKNNINALCDDIRKNLLHEEDEF